MEFLAPRFDVLFCREKPGQLFPGLSEILDKIKNTFSTGKIPSKGIFPTLVSNHLPATFFKQIQILFLHILEGELFFVTQ